MPVYHYETEDLSSSHTLRNLRCDTIRPQSAVTGPVWGGQVEIKSSLGANQKMIGRMCTLNMRVQCGIVNALSPKSVVPINSVDTTGTAITTFAQTPHTLSRNWLLSNFNAITISVNGIQVTHQQFPGLIKTANDIAFGGFTKDCGSGDAIPLPVKRNRIVGDTTDTSANGALIGGYTTTGTGLPAIDRSDWDFITSCNDTMGDSLTSVISCHIPCSVFESAQLLPGCTDLSVYFSINGQYRNLLLDDQTTKANVVLFSDFATPPTQDAGTVGVSVTDFWLNRYTVTDDSQVGLDQEMLFYNYFYQPNSVQSSNFSYTLTIPPATRKLLFCFVATNRGGVGVPGTDGQSSETDFNTGFSTTNNAVETCRSLMVRHDGNSYPAVQYDMAPLTQVSASQDVQRAYQDFIANTSANCDRLGPSLATKNQWALQKMFVWMLPQGGSVSSSQIEVTYQSTNMALASGQTNIICIAYAVDKITLRVDQNQHLRVLDLSRIY